MMATLLARPLTAVHAMTMAMIATMTCIRVVVTPMKTMVGDEDDGEDSGCAFFPGAFRASLPATGRCAHVGFADLFSDAKTRARGGLNPLGLIV